MYCTTCGKKIKKEVAFCPNCGEPLMNMSDIKPELEKNETFFDEENIMPTRGKWKWVIAVVIVVCVVASVSGILINSKMTDNKYNKKIEEARKYREQKNMMMPLSPTGIQSL